MGAVLGTAAAKAPIAMPNNASTKRHYSGINVLILWGAVIERGFAGQSWLTFRQALSLGGHLRKGERGTTVLYADRFVPNDEKRRAAETGEEALSIPFLKRFTVFNADQCDGLPSEIAAAAPPRQQGLIEPAVEALIKALALSSALAVIVPSMCRQKTMCRCRRRRPTSSRSIGIARRSTSLATQAVILHGSTAISVALLAPGRTRLRS